MTETTNHPTPRAAALALITTAALDEAARNDPAADSPPPANWEIHDCLTGLRASRQPGGLSALRATERPCLHAGYVRDFGSRFGVIEGATV